MIPADGTALDLAVRRLERAMGLLELRLAAKAAEAQRLAALAAAKPATSDEPGLFDSEERARLIADLEAAREREKALEEAGEQASVALGRAIAEIRAALGEEGVANDDHAHDEDEVVSPDPDEDQDLFDDPKSPAPKADGRGEG
ncbi:hypothetical protein [Caulobacter sp. SSI4214]|uniref:hypothetical protein n=1 Tax=Caulobacter sp. SSI4214 TaxID=2575739 RepID=UPI00143C99EB|nr:hypothetical protein [Caulobacter sp. SSI4214]